jgi:uncharacterized protein (DUF2132 family)
MESKSKESGFHGITLQRIVEQLVASIIPDTLGENCTKCFTDNPSIKSSLTF